HLSMPRAHLAIFTLSLHDALPIYSALHQIKRRRARGAPLNATECRIGAAKLPLRALLQSMFRQERVRLHAFAADQAIQLHARQRSEEHTSELQSRENLVCRLLLEK